MPRDGSKNLVPQNKRTKDEQKKIAQKGGKASGVSRRKKKVEKDRLKMLLELTPNMDLFLENDSKRKNLEMLGIDKDDIKDVETLGDLTLVLNMLKGDLNAKKYVDERMGRNPAMEIKRREIELKESSVAPIVVEKDGPTLAEALKNSDLVWSGNE